MNKHVIVKVLVLPAAALLLAACGSSSGTSGSPQSMPMSSSPASGMGMAHNATDVTFAQAMIPHHRQAVEMAKLAATRASSADLKSLAARIEAAQAPEITMMTGWLGGWGASMPGDMAGMDGMPGLMSNADMKALTDATGPAFDKMFLTMMIEHHKGALTMAQTQLAGGADPASKALAQSIIDGQTKEITEMKALLAGS